LVFEKTDITYHKRLSVTLPSAPDILTCAARSEPTLNNLLCLQDSARGKYVLPYGTTWQG
jgi:hypothetical protein